MDQTARNYKRVPFFRGITRPARIQLLGIAHPHAIIGLMLWIVPASLFESGTWFLASPLVIWFLIKELEKRDMEFGRVMYVKLQYSNRVRNFGYWKGNYYESR